MTQDELILLAIKYLEINSQRFNEVEKYKFIQSLQEWMDGKSETIDDEVYDFLIDVGLTKKPRREEVYVSYLNNKYKNIRFCKILDVGAGRLCKMTELIAKKGALVSAMDPNIRLLDHEAKKLGISKLYRQEFICDAYAKKIGKQGTQVNKYDLLVGLEPCDATEHIIRQGLKYGKDFDVLLCATPHNSINGKTFKSYEDWYEYLYNISSEVDIVQDNNKSYHATNNHTIISRTLQKQEEDKQMQ